MEDAESAAFNYRSSIKIGSLFLILVVVPIVVWWDADFQLERSIIPARYLHGAACLGAFALFVLVLFVVSARLRDGLLRSAEYYDRSQTGKRRVENLLLVGVGIWLAFLKWEQSRLLLTSVYDHGIFINVLWNTAHGNPFWNSFRSMNYLGDHFAPFLLLLSIPYRIASFQEWPVISQTIAMVFAIWLVLRIAERIHPVRPFDRALLVILFTTNNYFQKVHYHDMHPIAFGIPATILVYYLLKTRQWKWLYLSLPLILFSIQEDVSLMILGLGLSALFLKDYKKHGVALVLISAAAFWINVQLLIPHFAAGRTLYTARYETLGTNLPDMLRSLVLNPPVALRLFFDWKHIGSLLRVFISFGFLPFLHWPIPVAAIPAILQQSLSDYPGQYQYDFHYSANLLPFLMIGTVAYLSRIRMTYLYFIPLVLILIAYSSFQNPSYVRPRDKNWVRSVYDVAKSIDPQSVVSVQCSIGTPFAGRPHVYMFPEIQDAEWIILSPQDRLWPLQREELDGLIAELRQDRVWVETQNEHLLIFKRVSRKKHKRRV